MYAVVYSSRKGSAQTYDVIERRNSWNTGTNVTGIMMDSVTVSYTEFVRQEQSR
ncbi:hypothetical protein NXV33_18995 [Bacteroides thetaiotaomicron]|nr:hypothetical protein [Bacteroides thetaiotaomicron]